MRAKVISALKGVAVRHLSWWLRPLLNRRLARAIPSLHSRFHSPTPPVGQLFGVELKDRGHSHLRGRHLSPFVKHIDKDWNRY